MEIDRKLFKESIDGKETDLYILKNKNGMEVAITNYGARIVAIIFHDKNLKPIDVVVGFDSVNEYRSSIEPYHGAVVGRFANRIAKGKFSIHGKDYQLTTNNGPNHLHGGLNGFHKRVWDVEISDGTNVTLFYLSKDGEENYPGNLSVRITYTLSDENELILNYAAYTDQKTIINLTSHPFFNLNGQGSGTILNHSLLINADRYTPVDQTLIPIGIASVDGTPFDFQKPVPIGKRIEQQNQQLIYGGGYDHNFVLNGNNMQPAAKAIADITGIVMEVLTDQPGLQFYSGNFRKREIMVKYGLKDHFRTAFCLETQHFPDSPNHPDFPSTILEPGTIFTSKTVYRFSL